MTFFYAQNELVNIKAWNRYYRYIEPVKNKWHDHCSYVSFIPKMNVTIAWNCFLLCSKLISGYNNELKNRFYRYIETNVNKYMTLALFENKKRCEIELYDWKIKLYWSLQLNFLSVLNNKDKINKIWTKSSPCPFIILTSFVDILSHIFDDSIVFAILCVFFILPI